MSKGTPGASGARAGARIVSRSEWEGRAGGLGGRTVTPLVDGVIGGPHRAAHSTAPCRAALRGVASADERLRVSEAGSSGSLARVGVVFRLASGHGFGVAA